MVPEQSRERAPLVTVVTPVFNGARCIQRCIDSVRSQGLPRMEHLVIDGGSNDGTVAILERAAAADPRLRFVSARDAGVYDAMSRGVRMAAGEYVHILNADDRYAASGVLAASIALMERDSLDLCHGRARQVDTDGRLVCEFGRDIAFSELLKKMRIAHPTVVVRRSLYDRHGAFSVGFRIAADHEFLLRVWRKARIGFIADVQVLMEIGGLSTDNANVRTAYRESMAASIMHGRNPWAAAARCRYEIIKHHLIRARGFHHDATHHRPLLVPVGEPIG
jgi:glycosyltransferase involved in cell wall biosynthesis